MLCGLSLISCREEYVPLIESRCGANGRSWLSKSSSTGWLGIRVSQWLWWPKKRVLWDIWVVLRSVFSLKKVVKYTHLSRIKLKTCFHCGPLWDKVPMSYLQQTFLCQILSISWSSSLNALELNSLTRSSGCSMKERPSKCVWKNMRMSKWWENGHFWVS